MAYFGGRRLHLPKREVPAATVGEFSFAPSQKILKQLSISPSQWTKQRN